MINYFLNFVEEFWNVKPEYQGWHFGRIEVFEKGVKWPVKKLHFAAPPSIAWEKFREKWDFEEMDNLGSFKKVLIEFQQME